ncbi:MAG: exonuclease SbcCD subunit D [Candidatus Aenigmatarchaeota archaeon]
MKIAIFSDCHCGHAFGEERGEDSFLGLEEAIRANMDVDLILIAGDMFDSRVPKQEVFARTAKILGLSQGLPGSTRLVDLKGKEKTDISPLALRGIPIVAIHGTHERRSTHMVNPVQALEHAGLLIHLHCSAAVFNIGDKTVAIHGMSGVPERYAKDVLKEWNPQPIPGAVNIFMFHQSIEPYIYSPLDPPSLKIEDLPPGFDLYVLGHIHWRDIKDLHSGKLLLCGSTTHTSLHKTESDQQKGYYIFNGKHLEFVPLKSQRKIIWKEFSYNALLKQEMMSFLSELPEYSKKPIFIAKISGRLPTGAAPPVFNDIEKMFSNKVIFNISRRIDSEDFAEDKELIQALREQKLSPEEQGIKILVENLNQTRCGIKVEEVFELLVDGKTDLLFNLLTGKQKTLGASQ